MGKDAKHRKALLRNLSLSFLNRESIRTTEAKAKQLKPFIEKIITRARVDSLANRRLVYRNIRNTKTLKKLFEDVAKRFIGRAGGYTRIIKLGMRKGDASKECLMKLVVMAAPSEASEKDTSKKEKDIQKVNNKQREQQRA